MTAKRGLGYLCLSSRCVSAYNTDDDATSAQYRPYPAACRDYAWAERERSL